MREEYDYFEKKYNISQYSEIPICVVIPSYNNVPKGRYKDNLNSVLQQNYSNYHIVFIDDVSEDKTGEFVQKYVDELELKEDKIKIIINKEKKYAMQNLRYAAMNECKE
jgi:cellulose synthase/poly-beta-1,6-N-acetylglucosamine synthase-like glycosyltransferase